MGSIPWAPAPHAVHGHTGVTNVVQVRQSTGKLVKDRKWLVHTTILHEVAEHLHNLFRVDTQGVDNMLEILNARNKSPKLVDVNQAITNNWLLFTLIWRICGHPLFSFD